MATIVAHLWYPQLPVGRGLTNSLTNAEVDAFRQRLAEARTAAERSQSRRADAALLVDEICFSADLVDLLARDAQARLAGDGTLGSVPASTRGAFATELDALIVRYRERWLARNRPGGLEDSVAWLHNLRDAYATGAPDPAWGGLPAGR